MFKKIAIIAMASILFTGCASVKMESKEASQKAKEFSQPATGNAVSYTHLTLPTIYSV